MRVLGGIAGVALVLGAGGAAAQETLTWLAPAERLTLGRVFADASLANQAVMAGLVAAAIAAVLVWGAGLARAVGPEPSRAGAGLGFLKGVWLAGPLLGLLAASYTLLCMFIALANVQPTPSVAVLAPGFAEAALQVLLGLLAASVAVICHRHLEIRIRQVAARAAA